MGAFGNFTLGLGMDASGSADVSGAPPVTSYYKRPGGVDEYLRPGGVDKYTRP